MKAPLQPERCAAKLSALAAPERLKVVRYLIDGVRNVTEIADMLKTAPVNVSHHLGVLRRAGFVKSKKQGRFVLYSLNPDVLERGAEGEPVFLNLGCCRLEVPAAPAR